MNHNESDDKAKTLGALGIKFIDEFFICELFLDAPRVVISMYVYMKSSTGSIFINILIILHIDIE